MTVGIVNFGSGNLASVGHMLDWLGEEHLVVDTPEALLGCSRLVLPGVGAAPDAMRALRSRGLDQALREAVTEKGRPLLGICLGMQLLATRLTEFEPTDGLGWIDGDVLTLSSRLAGGSRVPHMGWSTVQSHDPDFSSLMNGKEFYFAHSFSMVPTSLETVAASVVYGGVELVAAVRKDTCLATQFHPEKSQVNGEKLMAAFLDWSP